MRKEQIAAVLSEFAGRHREDKESRRRLIYDVLTYIKTLEPGDRTDLREYLIASVAGEDPSWKLALEILVAEAASGTAPRLKAILDSREGSFLWSHLVILGLLELGEQTGRELYLGYIRSGLEQHREGARVLLAALCNIDPGSSVNMASEHFAKVLVSDRAGTEVRGSVPEFVRYYLKKDENLLPALVRETCLVNMRAGKRLRTLIASDLSNAAIVSAFEPRSVERCLISVLSY